MKAPNGGRRLDEVRADVLAALRPLEKHLESIDGIIAEIEAELADAREARRLIVRSLAALNPQAKPGPKPGGGKRKSPQVTQENLDAVKATVLSMGGDARFPDGFTVRDVANRAGNSYSHSTVSRMVNRLQDEGVIRLDHLGGHLSKERFFKVSKAE